MLHTARWRVARLRVARCGLLRPRRYLFDAESRELVLHIADGKQQRYPCTQVSR